MHRRLLTITLTVTCASTIATAQRSDDAFQDNALQANANSGVRVTTEVLGSIDGQHTRAMAVNNHGQVVGSGAGAAFLWTRQHGFQIIARGEGGGVAHAYDINDLGVVVGAREVCAPVGCSVVGFRWSNGTLEHLGSFIPVGLNESDEIAGYCLPPLSVPETACVRRDGVVVPIQLPPTDFGPAFGTATGINEHGDVVGTGDWNFVFGRNGRLRLFQGGFAFAINDAQMAVGVGGASRALVWTNTGRATTLPWIDTAAFGAVANAISNDALIVGTEARYDDDPGYPRWAVLWNYGQETGLRLGSFDALSEANDINERRQIVGALEVADNGFTRFHAVMWTVSYPLTVTTPNTAARWGLGTTQRLAWTYDGDAPQFQIDISRNGGETWDALSVVPNRVGGSQNFFWTITEPSTATARLRVTAIGDEEATDVNDGDIRIASAAIDILRPSGKTALALGSTQSIFFRHNLGARKRVAIDVSDNGGTTWRTIAETRTTGSTTSSHRWAVDLMPTSRAQVRVRARDGVGASDRSDLFVVVPITIPNIEINPLLIRASVATTGIQTATER